MKPKAEPYMIEEAIKKANEIENWLKNYPNQYVLKNLIRIKFNLPHSQSYVVFSYLSTRPNITLDKTSILYSTATQKD